MAQITWKSKAELDAEAAERQKQADIQAHEAAIKERQQAYVALLSTGAAQAELDECKAEIQMLMQSLEVLRGGTA
ncbi:MAG TPA: hypothetical protein GX506_07305 [Firmicutes bacterium]|nr:hypothetical protein [Bacillota bacterium]